MLLYSAANLLQSQIIGIDFQKHIYDVTLRKKHLLQNIKDILKKVK